MSSPIPQPPWYAPDRVAWCQRLLDSHRRWLGRELIPRRGTPAADAIALFTARLVVVSHGVEADPILNYGNRQAMELWDMDWDQLVRTPSRLTAEPVNRAERERMLEQAHRDGYIDGYRGVRISRSGRRFLVDGALVWNVVDPQGIQQGQAATFAAWTWLTD